MAETARTAGRLRERIRLEARGLVDDGMGGSVPGDEFETRLTAAANYLPLHGSETVQAARLQGRQPYVITVRQSAVTRQVTEAWRIVDDRDATKIFAITGPPTDPDGRGAWLEILAVLGAPS